MEFIWLSIELLKDWNSGRSETLFSSLVIDFILFKVLQFLLLQFLLLIFCKYIIIMVKSGAQFILQLLLEEFQPQCSYGIVKSVFY